MATKKLQQSDLMMRAGAQGEAAVQRAHEGRTQSAGRRKSQEIQERQIDESTEQRNLDRWQRQWEEKRSSDERKRQFDVGLEERQRQFDVSGEQRGQQFEQAQKQQAQQFEEKQDLQAAGQGLQRAPDPQTQARMNQMQAEMGRGDTQMAQGLEMGGQGGKWVATPGAKQAAGERADVAKTEADTARINAVANYQRSVDSYRIAEMKHQGASTAAGKAEAKAAMKVLDQQLMIPIKQTSGVLDRMMSIKGGTDQDWKTVNRMIDANKKELAGDLIAMKLDSEAGNWSPRLEKFVEGKLGVQALKYMQSTGLMPSGEMVDPSSEAMQTFSRHAVTAKYDAAMTDRLLSIPDRLSKVKYIVRRAAELALKGTPTPDPTPSTQGSQEADPTHVERRGRGPGSEGQPAGQPVTPPVRNITEDEAKRRALEPVPVEAPDRPEPGTGGFGLLTGGF